MGYVGRPRRAAQVNKLRLHNSFAKGSAQKGCKCGLVFRECRVYYVYYTMRPRQSLSACDFVALAMRILGNIIIMIIMMICSDCRMSIRIARAWLCRSIIE